MSERVYGDPAEWESTIAHVDMDAFFVGVELLYRPELRGKAVIVGADASRGVVTSASYEARRFGVHSAMPMVVAKRRCPEAIVVPVRRKAYSEISARVMTVLRRFSDLVEVVGIDEAYVDLSESPAPKTRARQLKHEVHAETGLRCSVGLAPNRLIAKIASDLDKPDGLCALPRERFLEVVGERPARIIPGVGPKTDDRLQRVGLRTVRDLAEADVALIEQALGPRHGPELKARAAGHGSSRLVSHRERKSESRERTFDVDETDAELMRERVAAMAREVCADLAGKGLRGRTVTLKIRLAPFRTFTRSRSLSEPSGEPEVIAATAVGLFDAFERDAPVRLLGVGISNLVRPGEPGQRDDDAPEPEEDPETPQLRITC